MRPLPAISLVIPLLISPAVSLYALPDSPCAPQCGNVLGSTTGDDIVCPDSSYPALGGSISAGITYQGCVSCQISSKYVDSTTGQTDLQWALYNLRYAISWCLFGYPNNTAVGDTPCITGFACGPLEDAFEFDSLSPDVAEYGYCADLNGLAVPKCAACLTQLGTELFLSNFLTALNAACQQVPAAGSTISIDGSLFSTTSVNITLPTVSSDSSLSSGPLNLGQRVGIAVGAILGVLIVAGFTIVCLGKRRRRQALKTRQMQSGYTDWQKHHGGMGGNVQVIPNSDGGVSAISGSFFDSPQSQRPLNSQNWGMPTQKSAHYESPVEQRYFSPYSSPISATDAVPAEAHAWPYPIDKEERYQGMRNNSTGSMRQRSRERAGVGEKIEMQTVAPVLMHPGHGRDKSVSLTEEDYRNGYAL